APMCSPCLHRYDGDAPADHGAEFWQHDSVRDALGTQHFGRFLAAYRAAHKPPLTQATIGRWLGMTQAQVSRLERAEISPSDLRKRRRWATILSIPDDLLWFTQSYASAESHVADRSASPTEGASLVEVHRRDVLKITGAVAGAGILAN